MINGSRLCYSPSLDMDYEIIFCATGNNFELVDVLTEDKVSQDKIPDAEIEESVKDTSELFEVWTSYNELPEEYISELHAQGVTVFED